MSKFEDFSLNPRIIQNLTDQGHQSPTPIQESTIPLLLQGHDLLGIAQTGTGKTAAFSLPILQHLLNRPLPRTKSSPRILILVPVRELALQIQTMMANYAKNLELKSTSIYGGVGQAEQIQQLRLGVEILIATPGRLLDLLEQKQVNLSGIEILVLDEADHMLDMGFIDDIKNILGRLPSAKQTMLFSATMPKEIENLAGKILKKPKKIEQIPEQIVTDKIRQKIIFSNENNKFQLLKKILKEENISRAIIFARTKGIAENIVEYLAQNRKASKAIHGDKRQSEREEAMQLFKDGSINVLVATDIAARGIDILGISHVINFNLPLNVETYIHRIGRTARAGNEGITISFCDDSEKWMLNKIQQEIRSELESEVFKGVLEPLKLKMNGVRKVTPPTPGKSQEKTAYLDHSKRQTPVKEGEKRVHPGLRNRNSKKRK